MQPAAVGDRSEPFFFSTSGARRTGAGSDRSRIAQSEGGGRFEPDTTVSRLHAVQAAPRTARPDHTGTSVGELFAAALPMIVLMLVVLVILTYVPVFSMLLPNTFF